MISIHTKPGQTGFSYLFNSFDGMWFHFEYLAISAGGNQLYGQENGFLEHAGEWKRISLGMPIMHIGITNMIMALSEEELQKASRLDFYSNRFIERLSEVTNNSKENLSTQGMNPTKVTKLFERLIEMEQVHFAKDQHDPYYPYYPYYPPHGVK